MKSNVCIYVFDIIADWEVGYLNAVRLLNSQRTLRMPPDSSKIMDIFGVICDIIIVVFFVQSKRQKRVLLQGKIIIAITYIPFL